ncbi:hypothetical protein BN59_03732 [Legionella massiliensis]|uniref:Uncharacterized protein n=1 Tax=Legionella massiliensis TaxID=1034943 RepID=A0A078L5T7_9GAMM|nr:hypothetical protein [Legionella massiliensis]CDZ79414.1 hypothetical protein BN59_03732 [Legionella massiliensis]CEE15152.1 hypothetical protein BN1094_03732 [Legionella massiliensis]
MNTNELKQAITEDLKRLKHLDIDIIPAKTYYTGLLKLAFNAFWKLGLVLFLSLLYVYLTYTEPHALMNEVYWGTSKTQPSYGEHIQKALFLATGITLIATLLLTPTLNSYYLIHYHLKDKLKTGDLLISKLHNFAWLFFGAFILFSILFASYAEPDAMFLFEIIALVLSAVVTYFVMGMEFNRVGLSLLLTGIGGLLSKNEKSTL